MHTDTVLTPLKVYVQLGKQSVEIVNFFNQIYSVNPGEEIYNEMFCEALVCHYYFFSRVLDILDNVAIDKKAFTADLLKIVAATLKLYDYDITPQAIIDKVLLSIEYYNGTTSDKEINIWLEIFAAQENIKPNELPALYHLVIRLSLALHTALNIRGLDEDDHLTLLNVKFINSIALIFDDTENRLWDNAIYNLDIVEEPK